MSFPKDVTRNWTQPSRHAQTSKNWREATTFYYYRKKCRVQSNKDVRIKCTIIAEPEVRPFENGWYSSELYFQLVTYAVGSTFSYLSGTHRTLRTRCKTNARTLSTNLLLTNWYPWFTPTVQSKYWIGADDYQMGGCLKKKRHPGAGRQGTRLAVTENGSFLGHQGTRPRHYLLSLPQRSTNLPSHGTHTHLPLHSSIPQLISQRIWGPHKNA